MEGEVSFTLRSAIAWPVPTAALQRCPAQRLLRLRGHPRPGLQRVETKPLQPTPRAASSLANVVAGGLTGERGAFGISCPRYCRCRLHQRQDRRIQYACRWV